jgi:hypothetical protein
MPTESAQRGSAKIAIYVICAFAIYYVAAKVAFRPVDTRILAILPNRLAAFVITYLLVGLPIFVTTWLIKPKGSLFEKLGFRANPWVGLAFAVLCTLPMFLGYAYLAGGFARGLSITVLVADNILAGVFEETYFRGFLFGLLYRKTPLGFLPAIALCSILFASGHLYQSTDPRVLFGILATTFMGSVWFAWLYVEWGYNIWVPMCLHSLMDTSWYLFDAGHNAMGGMSANVFRVTTVLLSIVVTIIYKRMTKKPFLVRWSTWWKTDRVMPGAATASGAVTE